MVRKSVGRRSIQQKQPVVDASRELPPEIAVVETLPQRHPFTVNAVADGPLRKPGIEPFPVPRFARGYAIWPATAEAQIGGRRLRATEIVIGLDDFEFGSTAGFPRRVHRGDIPWTLSGIAVDPETAQKIMAAESSKGFRVGLAQVGGSSFGIYRNLLRG